MTRCHKLTQVVKSCQKLTQVVKCQQRFSKHKLSQVFKLSNLVTICHKYLEVFHNCSQVVTTCLNCLKLTQVISSQHKYQKVMICLSQVVTIVQQYCFMFLQVLTNCLNCVKPCQFYSNCSKCKYLYDIKMQRLMKH